MRGPPMVMVTVVTTALLQATPAHTGRATCGPGQMVNGQGDCSDCPLGTYITESSHSWTDCRPCQKADPLLHEREAEKCTRSTNTKIVCDPGLFRTDHPEYPSLGTCTRCSKCGVGEMEDRIYEQRPCTDYNDTVCCARPTETAEEIARDERLVFVCTDFGGNKFQTESSVSTAPSTAATTSTRTTTEAETRRGTDRAIMQEKSLVLLIACLLAALSLARLTTLCGYTDHSLG